jgi:hypothetical protein
VVQSARIIAWRFASPTSSDSHWRWNFFAAKLFVTVKGWGDRVVRTTFAMRPLRQRVIALGAAYAIALAGLVANFGAAQAAADAIARPDSAICHSVVADQPAPSPDGTGNAICADCCCIGCITSIPVAVAPSAPALAIPQVLVAGLDPLTHSFSLPAANSKAHRSRGPPPVL